jgi:6-pyruvoyltetrahydropterin/6-carboxytetrahydropterin synthase
MYMIEIKDQFTAAHAIILPTGQREPSHTHCWQVRLFLSRKELDQYQMVVNFCEIQSLLKQVLASLESSDLNNVNALGDSPTAEVVAHFIFDQITEKVAQIAPTVKVKSLALSEAENCWAWYTCC